MKPVLIVGDHSSIHLYRWTAYARSLPHDVLSFSSKAEYPFEHTRRLFRPPVEGVIGKLAQSLRLFALAWTGRYRLIVFQSLSRRNAIFGLLVFVPFVIACYGTDVLHDLRGSAGIMRSLYRRALQKAAALTCDSGDVADILKAERRACRDGSKEPIQLITWGIDTEVFRIPAPNEKSRLREEYGIGLEEKVLLSIRTLSPHYRILDLIRWFKRRISDPRTRLFVHVNPYSDAAYVELCRLESADDRRILFHEGSTDFRKVTDYYMVADASLHFPLSDATPVSMLEGIACGNLIVCDKDIPAYEILAKRYELARLALADLGDHELQVALSSHDPEKNRRTLLQEDSSAATTGRIIHLVEEFAAGEGA